MKLRCDIVPYDKEFTERLADVLSKGGVPVFGPETGKQLLHMVNGLDLFMKRYEGQITPEMEYLLTGFRARLMDITGVAAHMQGNAINKLAEMIGSIKDK